MLAKRTIALVVLAVHIVCNGAGNGGKAGAGRDGHEPALGQKNIHELAEGHAGFDFDDARGLFETEDAVETAREAGMAIGIQCAVAVGTPGAIDADAARPILADRRRKIAHALCARGQGTGAANTAPSR